MRDIFSKSPIKDWVDKLSYRKYISLVRTIDFYDFFFLKPPLEQSKNPKFF